MGRPLVQSPKSHPGIPKDLDLANTPAQFKRHATYCRNIPGVYFSSSRLKNFLLSFAEAAATRDVSGRQREVLKSDDPFRGKRPNANKQVAARISQIRSLRR